MTKFEMLEAVLDKFKAEADANNEVTHSSAYARMAGALMVWVSEEATQTMYDYYITEAN